MAYRFDNFDNALVVDGWENGIAESPTKGISNLQGVNVISVPGEASVGFSTAVASGTSSLAANTVTSVSGSSIIFAAVPNLYNGAAITFTSVTGYSGITVGSCYWLANASLGSTAAFVFSDNARTKGVTVTGSGSIGFTFFNMAQPKYFTSGSKIINSTVNYFMVDSNGNVWSNKNLGDGYWTFMGNSVKKAGVTSTGNGITGVLAGGHNTADQSEGNGIIYYSGSGANGYLIVFSSSSADYMIDDSTNAWMYGWNITAGSAGSSASQFTMDAGETVNTSHQAILAPDGRVYFCDGYNIRKLFQKAAGVAFNPLDNTTYTYTNFPLLPFTDFAQCLAPLGVNILIGGAKNAVYVWDAFSTLIKYPLLLPENNISTMVTVDNNCYIFAGNRGRIYQTTGSAAKLYKKVPDHISTTVEPYFTWGGATYNKNSLYFGLYAVTNAKTTNANYGGVWAIGLENDTLRLLNQLSYGNYDGYATAIVANAGVDPAGAGLFIGWVNQVVNNVPTPSLAGLDSTSSIPYTNSTSLIESDLIPIGTFSNPRNSGQVEFKLATPLVAGESITLYSRTNLTASYGTLTYLTTPTTGDISGTAFCNFKNAQWLQIKAVLNSTATSPSYVRLAQLRVTGLVGSQGQ